MAHISAASRHSTEESQGTELGLGGVIPTSLAGSCYTPWELHGRMLWDASWAWALIGLRWSSWKGCPPGSLPSKWRGKTYESRRCIGEKRPFHFTGKQRKTVFLDTLLITNYSFFLPSPLPLIKKRSVLDS